LRKKRDAAASTDENRTVDERRRYRIECTGGEWCVRGIRWGVLTSMVEDRDMWVEAFVKASLVRNPLCDPQC
jgi:hypothetical protein